MNNEIHLSVRTLVEYVYQSGSIDSRFLSQTSMHEGTKIHQSIQKTYQENDQKEVYLRAELPFDQLIFIVDGRCDGLLVRDGEVIIDEIKSFSRQLEDLPEGGYPVHWAQAKMYAYMYARDYKLEEMTVQLTYVHVDTHSKQYMRKTFTFVELEGFASEMVRGYAPYALLKQRHRQKRNQSIKEVAFPFETYRAGQRKLAGAVYKTIRDEKSLFAMAPTGIGKTISTLFPAIKAMGEGHLNRVFYLTAKTITRTAAETALAKMRAEGLLLQSITITAKDKVCFQEETICQKDYCEFADGYYDRINLAVLDILAHEQEISREMLESYARKHKVCPFEFSIDLAYEMDAVICDYNYIFDPRVSLKRLLETQKKTTALLVDEAHNLVDRGREMFSASLQKSTFLQLKKDYKGKAVYSSATDVNAWFISLKKQAAEKKPVLNELDSQLPPLLSEFLEGAEDVLKNDSSPQLLEAYFEVKNFMKIVELIDESYIIYCEIEKNDVKLKLFCIDPSHSLMKMGKGYRSKVFFSATFSPLPYFRELLGGKAEDYHLSLPSPFSSEQMEVLIHPLSTRYRDRERTKETIARSLQDLIQQRPGNYLIFFPSYQYLLTVYEEFTQKDSQTSTLLQTTGMSEEEREAFLARFQPDQQETLIGFAVLGGIFSEGIDLIGDRLNGVVVVGVGLPQLSLERDLIKDYFNKNGKNGYNYAYIYPGMNKVLQAGGRLIRSEKDRGTIVLIDDRFLQNPYYQMLPPEWVTSYTAKMGP